MAHGENLSTSPDNPESGDNKQDGKKKRAVRVPLGLTPQQPAEAQPVEAPKVPARLFDILEQQQAERAQAQQAEHAADEGEKAEKKKKKRKKKSAEAKQPVATDGEEVAAETSQAEDSAETSEPAEVADTEQAEPENAAREAGEPADVEELTEAGAPTAEAEPRQRLVAEGAVEIPLDDHVEEEVALSERVMAWNHAQQQSPPRAPMSEVGQPLAEVEAQPEVPEMLAETEPASAPEEAVPTQIHEAMPEPRRWREQLEQQAQAEIDAATPRPVPPRSVTVPTMPSGPSMPPVPPEIMANQAPVQQPEVIEREVVRESPSDFWPGVVVGAGVEHIRHKRREKRMEQVQDTQQEQIKQLEDEQARAKLERELAERQQLRDAADAAQRERAVSPLESPLVAQLPLGSEQAPIAPAVPTAETPRRVEQSAPEELEEASPQTPDRHIETSSWHAIEVDNRTGHLVEQPNIEYGQAFHQERQSERLSAQSNDTPTAQTDAAGIPALPQPTAARPSDPRMMGVADDGQQAPSQPEASPVSPQPSPTKRPIIQSSADAALWAGLVIVVIAIVVALSL